MTIEQVYQASTSCATPADGRTQVAAAVAEVTRRNREAPPALPITEGKRSALLSILQADAGNSSSTQCRRLLAAMSAVGEITALEAREILDVVHAPARILNLDARGWQFGRRWVKQISARGFEHRTMAYSIAGEPEGGR